MNTKKTDIGVLLTRNQDDIINPTKFPATISGIVKSITTIKTKGGPHMAFLKIGDSTGEIECLVFPKCYENFKDILSIDSHLILEGITNLNEETRKFFPIKITLQS